MSLVKTQLGLPQVRGNSDVTWYISNYEYRQTVEGATYIPEGCFIMFSGTGNNAILSDGGNVIGISGFNEYGMNFENTVLLNNNYNQTYTKDSMNIAVQFLDADIDSGSTGDPVYVAEDGSGKATLTAGSYDPVGFLMSEIQTAYNDSRGKVFTGAWINFNGSRALPLASSGGGTVNAYTKPETDALLDEKADQTEVDTLTTTVGTKVDQADFDALTGEQIPLSDTDATTVTESIEALQTPALQSNKN